MSEREPNGPFIWRNGIATVERPLICRWITVIDAYGTEHRWMLKGNHEGMRLHTSLHGAAISPVFWSPVSMRNWLIANWLRPKGSDADCWKLPPEVTAAIGTKELVAA